MVLGPTMANAAAKSLSIIKLRRLNSLILACLIVLSAGTVTLSTYFFLKLRSLRRHLEEIEARLDELDESLTAANSPRPSILSLIESSSSSSDLYYDETSRRHDRQQHREHKKTTVAAEAATKKGILKKSVSFGSDLDASTTSSQFETPPSSPIERSSSFASIDESIAQLDDNKMLDLIQNEEYSNLKEMANQKQLIYENDKSNLNNLIDYIKTLYCLSEKETNPALRKDLELKAYELAKTSLDLYPHSYLSHKWTAITMSKTFDYISLNEKARLAFEMKKQLDVAIDLNSKDYILFYLRGRWYFKFYNMSWPEKYAVRLVFGNIPDDCLDAAFRDFLKADSLSKNKSKGNSLYLAKCYIERKQIPIALEYLNIARTLPTRSKEHISNDQEIQILLEKYSK